MNYRPVSLLHFLSQVFEKCMYTRINHFVVSNSILNSSQFGFLKGYSTSDAILNLTEFIYNSLDSGEIAINIFIDFKKAFDTLNHEILFQKLHKYGIRGSSLDLIRDYFSRRTQCVRVGSICSSISDIKLGVPQGSVLGPLFFLLYINDISNISNSIFTTLFADDTTISFKFQSALDIENSVNFNLLLLHRWTVCNRLTVNITKTFFNIITNRRLPCGFFPLNLHLNGHYISYKSKEKFLGLIFDDQLKFKPHISEVERKISKSIGILYRLRSSVPNETLRLLYFAFIYPYLTYCNIIWAGTFPCHLENLSILQKKAVRIINNAPFLAHTNDLFLNSHLLKLKDIHKLSVCIYMFKQANLTQFHRDHNYSTRNSHLLLPTYRRLSLTQHSITYTGPSIWNSLPSEIKSLSTVDSFKSMLKKYFISFYGVT